MKTGLLIIAGIILFLIGIFVYLDDLISWIFGR
jgi:hypothetical membrane protein